MVRPRAEARPRGVSAKELHAPAAASAMRPLALCLLLLAPLLAPAAASEDTVAVTLRFGAGYDLEANASCVVRVAPGADAIAVLDEALRTVCIAGYARAGDAGATRLTCLNRVCETYGMALNWAQFQDGELVERRLETFSAAEGVVLGFAYGVIPP